MEQRQGLCMIAHLKIFQAGVRVENERDFIISTEMVAIEVVLHDVEMLELVGRLSRRDQAVVKQHARPHG